MDLDDEVFWFAAEDKKVSIPRSEFCGFRLAPASLPAVMAWSFQFLDRNSVDLDDEGWKKIEFRGKSFNSSIGILWI